MLAWLVALETALLAAIALEYGRIQIQRGAECRPRELAKDVLSGETGFLGESYSIYVGDSVYVPEETITGTRKTLAKIASAPPDQRAQLMKALECDSEECLEKKRAF